MANGARAAVSKCCVKIPKAKTGSDWDDQLQENRRLGEVLADLASPTDSQATVFSVARSPDKPDAPPCTPVESEPKAATTTGKVSPLPLRHQLK
jgi:hypothetical protein